jgi:hypothetical protein
MNPPPITPTVSLIHELIRRFADPDFPPVSLTFPNKNAALSFKSRVFQSIRPEKLRLRVPDYHLALGMRSIKLSLVAPKKSASEAWEIKIYHGEETEKNYCESAGMILECLLQDSGSSGDSRGRLATDPGETTNPQELSPILVPPASFLPSPQSDNLRESLNQPPPAEPAFGRDQGSDHSLANLLSLLQSGKIPDSVPLPPPAPRERAAGKFTGIILPSTKSS